MARTYTIEPISLPTIFEDIVGQVSANLSTDSDLDIAQVSFKHGTRMVIQNALIADSMNPTDAVKNGKYPLVCLIHQFDEKPFDRTTAEINVQILICNISAPTLNSDQRLDDNYTPILNPIYAELKAVIAGSPYFVGYNQAFSHTKRDLYHTGKESPEGNDGYYLPDCIDGILLDNVVLKVNEPTMCDYVAPNLCLLTPCEYGREAYYENAIKSVTFTGLEASLLRVSLDDFYFVDNSGGLPPPFAPEIDWGTGGPLIAMTAPTPPATVPFTSTLDTSLLADGFYLGRISFDDSDVQFYYKITNGVVVKMTSNIEIDYSFDLTCADYPNNVIDSSILYTITKVDGEADIIVGYKYDLFGTQIVNETFNAVGTITKTNTDTNNFTGGTYTIIHKVERGGQTPLSCTLQIKTRCKTEF